MRHHKELGIPPFLKKTKQIELRLRHKDTLMGYPAIDLTHASCREPVMNPLEGSCQKNLLKGLQDLLPRYADSLSFLLLVCSWRSC